MRGKALQMFINQNCLSSQEFLDVPTLHMEGPSHPEFSAEYSIELHFIFHPRQGGLWLKV